MNVLAPALLRPFVCTGHTRRAVLGREVWGGSSGAGLENMRCNIDGEENGWAWAVFLSSVR